MKHFNFSNAEQWWQYWDQLMKCWETNSVLFTTLSTQWKVHNTAPPCGVISYTSRSVTCKTAAISQLICGQKCLSSTAGFEPAIFWSVVRRVIRCATRPYVLRGHDLTFWTASKWPLKMRIIDCKNLQKDLTEHGRTRTCNLPLRRRTRYPLRHAPVRYKEGHILAISSATK